MMIILTYLIYLNDAGRGNHNTALQNQKAVSDYFTSK